MTISINWRRHTIHHNVPYTTRSAIPKWFNNATEVLLSFNIHTTIISISWSWFLSWKFYLILDTSNVMKLSTTVSIYGDQSHVVISICFYKMFNIHRFICDYVLYRLQRESTSDGDDYQTFENSERLSASFLILSY